MDRGTIRMTILAVGIALAGWAAGSGFARMRLGDRYVTVKGFSEREVRADLAIWPLRVVASGNELAGVQLRLQGAVREIIRFLARQGVDTTDVALQDFAVTDARTEMFRRADQVSDRYVIRQTVVVRSTDPDKVLAASQRVGELVAAGVVLSSGEFGAGGPTFVFTGLNALKPEMIAEATSRAREAAEQFATDAQSSLAGIRQASQGVFAILPRDQAPGISEQSQIVKTVRVVTTVEYRLR